jgi:hypothetical protein
MSRDVMKLALEALEEITDEVFSPYDNKLGKAITALREALAEQPAQQEPVTWGVDWGKAGDIPCVSIIKRLPGGGIEVVAVEYAPYSYTSPPAQRTWVGLSDEEYINITDSVYHKGQGLVAYYKAIEAKLRSKNNG